MADSVDCPTVPNALNWLPVAALCSTELSSNCVPDGGLGAFQGCKECIITVATGSIGVSVISPADGLAPQTTVFQYSMSVWFVQASWSKVPGEENELVRVSSKCQRIFARAAPMVVRLAESFGIAEKEWREMVRGGVCDDLCRSRCLCGLGSPTRAVRVVVGIGAAHASAVLPGDVVACFDVNKWHASWYSSDSPFRGKCGCKSCPRNFILVSAISSSLKVLGRVVRPRSLMAPAEDYLSRDTPWASSWVARVSISDPVLNIVTSKENTISVTTIIRDVKSRLPLFQVDDSQLRRFVDTWGRVITKLNAIMLHEGAPPASSRNISSVQVAATMVVVRVASASTVLAPLSAFAAEYNMANAILAAEYHSSVHADVVLHMGTNSSITFVSPFVILEQLHAQTLPVCWVSAHIRHTEYFPTLSRGTGIACVTDVMVQLVVSIEAMRNKFTPKVLARKCFRSDVATLFIRNFSNRDIHRAGERAGSRAFSCPPSTNGRRSQYDYCRRLENN